jgi:hypothetical protein
MQTDRLRFSRADQLDSCKLSTHRYGGGQSVIESNYLSLLQNSVAILLYDRMARPLHHDLGYRQQAGVIRLKPKASP